MRRLHKHFHFKNDSWMWITWVRHDGFGLRPKLMINKKFQGVDFYFNFMWWKLEWYWTKPKVK